MDIDKIESIIHGHPVIEYHIDRHKVLAKKKVVVDRIERAIGKVDRVEHTGDGIAVTWEPPLVQRTRRLSKFVTVIEVQHGDKDGHADFKRDSLFMMFQVETGNGHACHLASWCHPLYGDKDDYESVLATVRRFHGMTPLSERANEPVPKNRGGRRPDKLYDNAYIYMVNNNLSRRECFYNFYVPAYEHEIEHKLTQKERQDRWDTFDNAMQSRDKAL